MELNDFMIDKMAENLRNQSQEGSHFVFYYLFYELSIPTYKNQLL